MAVDDAATIVKDKRQLQRQELLIALQGLLELPMVILSLLMLLLFVIEVSLPLPAGIIRWFNLIQWIIWFAFILEFAVKISIAPNKVTFLREHWLMALAIALPVLRVFRILRAAKAFRSLGAIRVIALGNRTINQLGVLFERRRLQYVAAVLVAVLLLSGAGMLFLERNAVGANIITFGDGLWWAAGAVTTVGTEKYPITAEGRVLAFIVMVFGVSIFGYIAGSLASFFIGLDQSDISEEQAAAQPGGEPVLDDLTEQIKRLRERVAALDLSIAGLPLERSQDVERGAPPGGSPS